MVGFSHRLVDDNVRKSSEIITLSHANMFRTLDGASQCEGYAGQIDVSASSVAVTVAVKQKQLMTSKRTDTQMKGK